MTGPTKGFKSAVLGVCLLAAAACTTQYRNHGYAPTSQDLEEVGVGVDTRDRVAETIGTPSASGVLDEGGYYYVRSRVRHYGARKPKVVERRVVAVTFDQRGVVRNVAEYSLEDGQVVPLSRRVTDGGVEERGVLAQLLANIGNFGGFNSNSNTDF
jgi:outer membrane protein assembly factor BamE (lipoprotein component of BamABCDE complex)